MAKLDTVYPVPTTSFLPKEKGGGNSIYKNYVRFGIWHETKKEVYWVVNEFFDTEAGANEYWEKNPDFHCGSCAIRSILLPPPVDWTK